MSEAPTPEQAAAAAPSSNVAADSSVTATDATAAPAAAAAPAADPAAPVTAPQPASDPAPAAPADHPAAPDPNPVVQPPQFGGATPDTSVEAATKAAADPGYVSAKPLLTTGAYGHDVYVLAKLLQAAGHPNAVAAGLEPPMLTDELMRHVLAFQQAQGIDPTAPQAGLENAPGADPNGPSGAPLIPKNHGGIVDWRTWGALYDAAAEDVELAVDSHYQAGAFA